MREGWINLYRAVPSRELEIGDDVRWQLSNLSAEQEARRSVILGEQPFIEVAAIRTDDFREVGFCDDRGVVVCDEERVESYGLVPVDGRIDADSVLVIDVLERAGVDTAIIDRVGDALLKASFGTFA
jgi:hypothetical protein